MVEELLPGAVAVVAELDTDDRADLGLEGLDDEFHARIRGYSAELANISLHAAADNVLPGNAAVTAPGYDVVADGRRDG